MAVNWIDYLILALVLYEAYRGWKAGFIALGITFISFAISLWLAIILKTPVSAFFTEKFGIADVWSTLISYIGIASAGQIVLVWLFTRLISHIPPKLEKSVVNSILGALISGINSLTTIAFVLLLILAIPMKGSVRSDIRSSVIGGAIVKTVEKYGGPVKFTFELAQQTATKFLTVSPGSTESMPLDIQVKQADLEVNDQAERELLALVNKERVAVGAPALVVDVTIVRAARAHSQDMYMKKYFSHVSPDGLNLGDRLKKENVAFSLAGENLAFAPDVASAHQGLMNSPEHKKNMLDPQFRHVGIGIISSHAYGLMVTQDFTN